MEPQLITFMLIAFTFMLIGVCSNFKEVLHISPVTKINHEILFSLIKYVIIGFEETGYKMFCIITDNNAINSKAMSSFLVKKQLSIVYSYPAGSGRPLFYLFNSIHLLKCIKNNWMNSNPDNILTYPDFETLNLIKFSSFQSLITLPNSGNEKISFHFHFIYTIIIIHIITIQY